MTSTSLPIRRLLCHVGAGLLVTAVVAVVPVALTAPASANPDRPACSKEDPGGSSNKKCPTPTPTKGETEVGCRDITEAGGDFSRIREATPELGSTLNFTLIVDNEDGDQSPTCPEVTYTVIARDMDTLAELARLAQPGNGVTSDLTAVLALPLYSKNCVAVDIIVSEGDVVHDIAPNSRDTSLPQDDLCLDGSGPQTWN